MEAQRGLAPDRKHVADRISTSGAGRAGKTRKAELLASKAGGVLAVLRSRRCIRRSWREIRRIGAVVLSKPPGYRRKWSGLSFGDFKQPLEAMPNLYLQGRILSWWNGLWITVGRQILC